MVFPRGACYALPALQNAVLSEQWPTSRHIPLILQFYAVAPKEAEKHVPKPHPNPHPLQKQANCFFRNENANPSDFACPVFALTLGRPGLGGLRRGDG